MTEQSLVVVGTLLLVLLVAPIIDTDMIEPRFSPDPPAVLGQGQQFRAQVVVSRHPRLRYVSLEAWDAVQAFPIRRSLQPVRADQGVYVFVWRPLRDNGHRVLPIGDYMIVAVSHTNTTQHQSDPHRLFVR